MEREPECSWSCRGSVGVHGRGLEQLGKAGKGDLIYKNVLISIKDKLFDPIQNGLQALVTFSRWYLNTIHPPTLSLIPPLPILNTVHIGRP